MPTTIASQPQIAFKRHSIVLTEGLITALAAIGATHEGGFSRLQQTHALLTTYKKVDS